jgi:hypothetical protein
MPPLSPPTPGKMVVDFTVTLSDADATKIEAIALRGGLSAEEYMSAAIRQLIIQERQPIRKQFANIVGP